MKRGRGEYEGDVVLGKGIVFPEGVSEGMDLRNELGVREGACVSSVDSKSGIAGGGGGGGADKREDILREGERLRRWWERYEWPETVESPRLGTETGVWIYRTVGIVRFCHRSDDVSLR